MATSDAPGMLFRYASTPRMKSRWSYSRSAVSGVGAPSLNSSVPSSLCTVSGVVIEAGGAAVVVIAKSPEFAQPGRSGQVATNLSWPADEGITHAG